MKTPKIVLIYETEKESGSENLENYLQSMRDVLQEVDYCFNLNSECYDYNNFYVTSSNKGEIVFDLEFKILKTQFHSGMGSGIIADPFRILIDFMEFLEVASNGEQTS